MKYNLIIFGTRPEYLKIVPIIQEIRKRGLDESYKLLFTNQHKELVEDLFPKFEIYPDFELNLCNKNQSISKTLTSILDQLEEFYSANKKQIQRFIIQGDTTTCLASALVAKLNQIPLAHIEAGLRTYDHQNPFPEEYFRQIISISADIHFTPTKTATENLLNEGIHADKILQTGNTIVDLVESLKNDNRLSLKENQNGFDQVLITCHRRENQNGNFSSIKDSILELCQNYPNTNFSWVLHENPVIKAKMEEISLNKIKNLEIIKPLNIFELIKIYSELKLIITDSGGIQEEAVSFNVPTIVLREKTERTEAIEIGNSILSGCSKDNIIKSFHEMYFKEISNKENPFGDGKASERIIDYLESIRSPKQNEVREETQHSS